MQILQMAINNSFNLAFILLLITWNHFIASSFAMNLTTLITSTTATSSTSPTSSATSAAEVIASTKLSKELSSQVASFASEHGFTATNLVLIGSTKSTYLVHLISALNKLHVQLAVMRLEEIQIEPYVWLENKYIFVLDPNKDENETMKWMTKTMRAIRSTRIESSILVIPSRLSENFIQNGSQRIDINAYFYELHSDNSFWHQVQHLNKIESVIRHKLSFKTINKCRSCFRATHNFLNVSITSTALNWAPYLELINCDSINHDCDVRGILWDVTESLERLLNLEVRQVRDEQLDWGVLPVAGAFNRSAEWQGVMGDVVRGRHHLSLSAWTVNAMRGPILDLPVVRGDAMLLTISPRPKALDMGLFLRPFTREAWVAIVIGLIIIVLTLTITYLWSRHHVVGRQWSFRLATVSSWLFFVMINAFYGGALTMFFTSAPELPFNSLREVIHAYPQWTLIVLSGNDVQYVYKARQGDPDFVLLWDRLQKYKSSMKVETYDEAFERLGSESIVFHVHQGQLKDFLRRRPSLAESIQQFAKERRAQLQALALTDNSPLTPGVEHALLKLREEGSMERLIEQWEGQSPSKPPAWDTDTMILTPGQVVLVYIIIGSGLLGSLVTLGVEFAVRRWDEKARREEQRMRMERKQMRKKTRLRQIINHEDVVMAAVNAAVDEIKVSKRQSSGSTFTSVFQP